ncbi:MAG: hypothetical protein RR513_09135 [Muribaculaceae bacterium]
MITPEIKDELLKFLCENCPFETYLTIDKPQFLAGFKHLTKNEIVAVFMQFDRYGFISDFVENSQTLNLILMLDASDFLRNGGFSFQEKILHDNIEKLTKELALLSKELEPKHLDSASKIASICSAITGALPLFGV